MPFRFAAWYHIENRMGERRMKTARFFSGLFGTLGGVLMVLGVVTGFWFQGRTQERQVPREAARTAQQWMDALSQGDLDGASGLMYGSVSLNQGEGDAQGIQALVEAAYWKSLSCTAQTLCRTASDGVEQQVLITVLDLDAVWDAIEERAKALTQNGAPVEQSLLQAAQEVLDRSCPTVSSTVPLRLIYREGQWRILPDRALEQALAGQSGT